MSSQTDLDQGGTFRQTQKVYMGPSVGWVTVASQVVLPVTAAGTTTIQKGNSLVTVNVNGSVTLQLPLAKANVAGPQAVPNEFAVSTLTIVDIGGFAASFPITINRAGAETIDGLTSIVIDSAFAVYVLRPDVINGGWTLVQ